MKKEKSCGVIVFKDNKVLLVRHNLGRYGLPKGHVEENETEKETALREVKEETNVDTKIIDGFREVITYSPKENVMKDVVFFIGTCNNYELKVQESEVSEAIFVDIEKAIDTITYNDERRTLIEAIEFYKKFKNI